MRWSLVPTRQYIYNTIYWKTCLYKHRNGARRLGRMNEVTFAQSFIFIVAVLSVIQNGFRLNGKCMIILHIHVIYKHLPRNSLYRYGCCVREAFEIFARYLAASASCPNFFLNMFLLRIICFFYRLILNLQTQSEHCCRKTMIFKKNVTPWCTTPK